jgi:signal transduction histidine kinase
MNMLVKRGLLYTIGLILVSLIIYLVHYLNNFLVNILPNYPQIITVVLSADLVVTIILITWLHFKKINLLKYEFVTTVTHKLRTPITAIKWSMENLLKSNTISKEDSEQVGYIKSANEKLVELMNILITSSETEGGSHKYILAKNNLSNITNEMISSISNQLKTKQLNITNNIESDLFVLCELERIKFVIQTLVENAIHYTPRVGTLTIKLKSDGKKAIFSIHDTGIGISKDQLSLIFSKFYRTHEAQKTDNQGMGIGLFIAREVISRHKGKIWVESEGLNHGSTFSFSLNLA